MKANELRLNNYVKAFKTYWQIDNTDFSNLEKIETYEFIPLTEEMLLKCGFNLNPFNQKFKEFWIPIHNLKAELFCERHNDKDNVFILRSSFCELVLDPIKSLHQLQNLYFALTGQELEINL